MVCCPLCHVNLDLKQDQINKYLGTDYQVPILYLPQVLGVALGLSFGDVMLEKNVVDPRPLVKRAISESAVLRAEEERKAAEKAAKAAAKEGKAAKEAPTQTADEAPAAAPEATFVTAAEPETADAEVSP